MKVIQVPFCFHPDPVGGTEVYVEALSHHLQHQGISVSIAAPGHTNQSYLHQQLPVHRFAVSSTVTDIQEMYGEGDALAALEFAHLLDQEKPDLVHLHAFTRGVSLRLVHAAKQRQIPVVFTYHTPTVSCQRGTLMQWGKRVCDGKLDLKTCSQCTLHSLGLTPMSAKLIGSLPSQVGTWLGHLQLQGNIWTALRMTELVAMRQQTFHALMAEVDHVVAVCHWVREVLLLNHVPANKITLLRQGLCHDLPNDRCDRSHHSQNGLSIAFLGRSDPVKGIHILISAIRSDPQLPVSLDIYGISQGSTNDAYQQMLLALAENDPRITFKVSIPPAQVTTVLAAYDLLAVPSQWLETGPMVVLEAFAAGVPVLGSNLGGIAELVQCGVNGVLVEATSVEAWSEALRNLCHNQEQLMQLRQGIRPPETMETVSDRIYDLYQSLL